MIPALHTPGPPGQPGPVDAAAARLDDAGLIAAHGPGALNVRTGVLHGPGSTALITGTPDTAPMAVLVAAHHWVTTRQASDGVYRGTVEAPTRVTIGAAPASGSRIDVVYVKQNDQYSTITPDGDSTPVVAVQPGQPGQGKPPIPVGAQELGTVTVSAGATRTDGAGVVITNTARQTVARGARVPVRSESERNALTRFAGLEVYRLDTGAVELCPSASGTNWLTAYNPASQPYLPQKRLWTFARTGNVSDAFAAGSFVSLLTATIPGAPAGDYAVTARLVISNTTGGAGFQRTFAGGVSISPSDPRADTIGTARVAFVQSGGVTHAGGNLTVELFYQATGGTGTVWTQGTEVALTYLGPS